MSCKSCQKSEELHPKCFKCADCNYNKTYRPSACKACLSLFHDANRATPSIENKKAQKFLNKWIGTFIHKRKASKSIHGKDVDIWFSTEEEEGFPVPWLTREVVLGVGRRTRSTSSTRAATTTVVSSETGSSREPSYQSPSNSSTPVALPGPSYIVCGQIEPSEGASLEHPREEHPQVAEHPEAESGTALGDLFLDPSNIMPSANLPSGAESMIVTNNEREDSGLNRPETQDSILSSLFALPEETDTLLAPPAPVAQNLTECLSKQLALQLATFKASLLQELKDKAPQRQPANEEPPRTATLEWPGTSAVRENGERVHYSSHPSSESEDYFSDSHSDSADDRRQPESEGGGGEDGYYDTDPAQRPPVTQGPASQYPANPYPTTEYCTTADLSTEIPHPPAAPATLGSAIPTPTTATWYLLPKPHQVIGSPPNLIWQEEIFTAEDIEIRTVNSIQSFRVLRNSLKIFPLLRSSMPFRETLPSAPKCFSNSEALLNPLRSPLAAEFAAWSLKPDGGVVLNLSAANMALLNTEKRKFDDDDVEEQEAAVKPLRIKFGSTESGSQKILKCLLGPAMAPESLQPVASLKGLTRPPASDKVATELRKRKAFSTHLLATESLHMASSLLKPELLAKFSSPADLIAHVSLVSNALSATQDQLRNSTAIFFKDWQSHKTLLRTQAFQEVEPRSLAETARGMDIFSKGLWSSSQLEALESEARKLSGPSTLHKRKRADTSTHRKKSRFTKPFLGQPSTSRGNYPASRNTDPRPPGPSHSIYRPHTDGAQPFRGRGARHTGMYRGQYSYPPKRGGHYPQASQAPQAQTQPTRGNSGHYRGGPSSRSRGQPKRA